MDQKLILQLYSRYGKELYLYIFSLCRQEETAKDLLHETFLKAMIALPEGITNTRAWLYRVAKNLVFNQMKKQKWEAAEENLPEPSTDEDLLADYLRDERYRILYDAISRLEERKREILVMQYFGNLSQKEIAAILHMTPENVRVLACRAKKELKREMEGKL